MIPSEHEVQRHQQIREDTVVKPMLQTGIGLVLEHLIRINANDITPRSSFHSQSTPPMSITDYVNRIVRHSGSSSEALVAALMFLQFHVTFSGHKITVYNVHRVFLIAVIVASKSRDDVYYTNSYYCKVGGIDINELRNLELSFIVTIGWDCWLDKDAFDETYAMLEMFASTAPDDEEAKLAIEFWMNKQSQLCRTRRSEIEKRLALDNAINDQKTGDISRIPASPVVSNQQQVHRSNLEAVADAAPFFPNSVKRVSGNNSQPTNTFNFPNQGRRGNSGSEIRTSLSAGGVLNNATSSSRQTPVSAAYIPRRQKTPSIPTNNIPPEESKIRCETDSKPSSKTSLDDVNNGPSGDAEENEDPVLNVQTAVSSSIASPNKVSKNEAEEPPRTPNERGINNNINNGGRNIYTPGDFGGGFSKSGDITPMKGVAGEGVVFSNYQDPIANNSSNSNNNNRYFSKSRFSSFSSVNSMNDDQFNIIGRSKQRPGYPNFYPTSRGRKGGKKHHSPSYDASHKNSHFNPYSPTRDKIPDYSAFGSGFGITNNNVPEHVNAHIPNCGVRLTNEPVNIKYSSNDMVNSPNLDVGNGDDNGQRSMKPSSSFTEQSTKQNEGKKGAKAKKRTMPEHWQEDRY